MGSANVDVLTAGYAAMAARDDERLMACLAEDVELRTLTGVYHRHQGIRQWIADMDDGWHPWELTIEDAQSVGERVLVEATLTGRSSLNDIALSHRFWVVWELTDGRATLGTHFADYAEAVRCASRR